MVSFKIIASAAWTLFTMSFAAPAPTPGFGTISAATAAIKWTSVDFNGKTIYVNSALIPSSVNPASKTTRDLFKRGPTNDCCGGSTINSHPSPFAYTGDCEVIRDWADTQNSYWGVWSNTPDTHGLLYYGTCVFEAGTPEQYTTWIGSTDIRDLTRDSLNKWASNGQIAAQGEMRCANSYYEGSTAVTRWSIKHS